ncbi:MAG: cupin domain-containing protein [Phycisphaerae bacterium]|nr:cupin domain-containing protein [Phycisphaerae bacterium]
MNLQPIESYQQNDVEMDGAEKVKMRMLIGPEHGAKNFHMRHFEVAPGGHTPHHQHDYEHEVFVLKGTGHFKSEQGDRPFKPGDVAFIPATEKHGIVNDGDTPCEIICLIPAAEDCSR